MDEAGGGLHNWNVRGGWGGGRSNRAPRLRVVPGGSQPHGMRWVKSR